MVSFARLAIYSINQILVEYRPAMEKYGDDAKKEGWHEKLRSPELS